MPWVRVAHWRSLASLALLVALTATPALAAGPEMAARPAAVATATVEKRSGVLQLAGGAYAYLPKSRNLDASPVLVALHGAGGQAAQVLESFRQFADRDGIVLVIPQSGKATWDMVEDLKSRLGVEMNVQPRYGKDLKSLDTALADLFTKVAADPARVGIMGFSDGATYALSVGSANPELFRQVIAFSPGPAFLGKTGPRQSFFVSHGESDKVLPFSVTRGHVAKLRVRKAPVVFERFNGGHEVPKEIKEKAFVFFRNPAIAIAASAGADPSSK